MYPQVTPAGYQVSFYRLLSDPGAVAAIQRSLTTHTVQDIWDRLTGLYWGMETLPDAHHRRSYPGDSALHGDKRTMSSAAAQTA